MIITDTGTRECTCGNLPNSPEFFPYDLPIEAPTSVIAYEPNGYSLSGNPSSFTYPLPYYLPLEEPISYQPYAPSDFTTIIEHSSLPYTIPNDITTEKLTLPYKLPTEVTTLVLHSEPNKFSPSGDTSRFTSPFPPESSPEDHISVPDSTSYEP